MSKPRSKLVAKADKDFRLVKGVPVVLHFGKQTKHMPGHTNFIPGKSIITLGIGELQRLVEDKVGTGTWKSKYKEQVDFESVIGIYVNPKTGDAIPTTVGIVHYSKSGLHVVPASPNS